MEINCHNIKIIITIIISPSPNGKVSHMNNNYPHDEDYLSQHRHLINFQEDGCPIQLQEFPRKLRKYGWDAKEILES